MPETILALPEYEDPAPEEWDQEETELHNLLVLAMEILQQANNGEFEGNLEMMQKIDDLTGAVVNIVGLLQAADDDEPDQVPQIDDAVPEADPVSMGC